MVDETLRAEVYRKLNITWEDPDTKLRVEEIMESAIPIMLHKLGIADPRYDFSQPGIEKSLYKSYCLYEWNHCASEFDKNYLADILQCRERHSVEAYEEEGDVK